MEKKLMVVGEFLKHEFKTHLEHDGDPVHDTNRALVGCTFDGAN